MKLKRKKISILCASVLLLCSMCIPVSAKEIVNRDPYTGSKIEADSVERSNGKVAASGTNYFSGTTTKLNSYNGLEASSIISSGSCLGTTRSITKVTVYCRVSSGSSRFTLIVTSPNGTVQEITCGTSSTTYIITDFNGEDPKGNWKIAIATKGVVSTVTATLKVYYSYS